MPLPEVPLATGTADVAGTTVQLKSLSRADVIALAGMAEDPAGAEVLMLSSATGSTPEEADAWRKATDAKTAGDLLAEIAYLSGMRPRPNSRASSKPSSAG